MPDERQTIAHLHEAEYDLKLKLNQLEDMVTQKFERPRMAAIRIEQVVDWIRRHEDVAVIAALAVVAVAVTVKHLTSSRTV